MFVFNLVLLRIFCLFLLRNVVFVAFIVAALLGWLLVLADWLVLWVCCGVSWFWAVCVCFWLVVSFAVLGCHLWWYLYSLRVLYCCVWVDFAVVCYGCCLRCFPG